MATVCAECVNLVVRDRGAPWWKWECIQRPRSVTFNPVDGRTCADPAYLFCKDLNAGECKHFEAGPNTLHPVGSRNDQQAI